LGLTAAVAAGLASLIPAPIASSLAVGTALLFMGIDFGWLRLHLPQNARQVPQSVVLRGPHTGAFQFGFELGTGMRAYLTTAAPYALVVGAVFIAAPAEAILAGAAFGAGRATMTLTRFASGNRDAWDELLAQRLRLIERACSCLTGVSIVLLTVLV